MCFKDHRILYVESFQTLAYAAISLAHSNLYLFPEIYVAMSIIGFTEFCKFFWRIIKP